MDLQVTRNTSETQLISSYIQVKKKVKHDTSIL